MSILDILNELDFTASRLKKESILRRESNNDTLKTIFNAALNPYKTYYLKQVRQLMPQEHAGTLGIDTAIAELDAVIANRKLTGNAAKIFVVELLTALSSDNAEVLARVIERDLRCGVNTATVNKVWKDSIPVFEVMKAGSNINKIRYPAFAQLKADGVRCHLYWNGATTTALSRNGKFIMTGDSLHYSANCFMRPGETWDGELLCVDPVTNKILDRKTGNGIINKAIKGTITEEETKYIRFMVWDIVDFSGTKPYSDRWNTLKTRFSSYPGEFMSKFMLIESEVVNSQEDAQLFFEGMLARGEEGAILKNMDSVWEPKRSDNLCKLKDIQEASMRCVGWEKGSGRNADRLGNLIFSSEDGNIVVGVGSGFSDDDRDILTPENTFGQIANILYNTVIKSKVKDKSHSLFLPRFNGWELDKNDADYISQFKGV